MDRDRPEKVMWGEQTERALANFGHTAGPLPRDLIHAIVAIKIEAAVVNAELEVLPWTTAEAIVAAGEEVLAGHWDDQFPVDVFQTGSGTSTNMNVNEVLARRATELAGHEVHPNDHTNASQSSNDVFPSAIRIATLDRLRARLEPALYGLHARLRELQSEHADTVKLGRTHLMDAVPMTFGQEVGGWARSVEIALARVGAVADRLCELPLGGTAVGTGLNAPVTFGARIAERLARRFDLDLGEAADHFEAQGSQEVLCDVSAACRTVALALNKVAGDIRLLGSGPTSGFGEIHVPDLQAGSSIMPGKLNPVILEVVQQITAQVVGHDAALTFASAHSTLQLNTAMPLMAHDLLESIALVTRGAELLAERCVADLQVDAGRMRQHALRSPSLVTALAPEIGYERAAAIAHRMVDEGLTIEQATRHELGDEAWEQLAARVDPAQMARGASPQS